jgi:hypothetical protein
MSLPGWLGKLEYLGATNSVYSSFCPVLWEPFLCFSEQCILNLLKHTYWFFFSLHGQHITKIIAFKRGGTLMQIISLQGS